MCSLIPCNALFWFKIVDGDGRRVRSKNKTGLVSSSTCPLDMRVGCSIVRAFVYLFGLFDALWNRRSLAVTSLAQYKQPDKETTYAMNSEAHSAQNQAQKRNDKDEGCGQSVLGGYIGRITW